LIEFKPAIRVNTPFIGALAGASGSGKTKTALELAVGLAGPNGKIAGIDSEGRRMLHYADDYKFDHGEWRPPFEPSALLTALKDAEKAGYAVIIVDSASDEYEGEGGLQDMAAADLAAQRGDGNSAAAWARPKAQHKLIIKWLRQCRCHVIFCLRAEEKVKFEKRYNERKGREETVIVPIGWVPICEKRFMFDMTTSLLFTPDQPGVPHPIKLYEKHAPFFPEGKQVTREAGRLLAEWAAGGLTEPAAAIVEPKVAPFELMQAGDQHAKLGIPKLREWWNALTPQQRGELGAHGRSVGPHMEHWKKIATAIDIKQASAQPSPLPPEPPAEGDNAPGDAPPQADTFGLMPLNDDEAFCDNILNEARGYEDPTLFDKLSHDLADPMHPRGKRANELPREMWRSFMAQLGEIGKSMA
jgi:hypothetical protein